MTVKSDQGFHAFWMLAIPNCYGGILDVILLFGMHKHYTVVR